MVLNWFTSDQKNSDYVIAEYIWIDGSGEHLRSKSRTLDVFEINDITDIPNWNYDGSSTDQAQTERSEILLQPVFFCKDPFRKSNSILVLCAGFQWECDTSSDEVQVSDFDLSKFVLKPAKGNFREYCKDLWESLDEDDIWFGVEQEYVIKGGEIQVDGRPYYCGQGSHMQQCRKLSESHYQNCLKAGISIHGTNSEVLHNQWEYQIGICKGIDMADQLWMSRFILIRTAEQMDLDICFTPKPVFTQNGSGAHVNFSTKATRLESEFELQLMPDAHQQCIKRLEQLHTKHIEYYGKGNESRLIGSAETSDYSLFSKGVDNRNCSIRIPTFSNNDNDRCFGGYIEDRRPSANMNPYVVCTLIAQALFHPDNTKIIKQLIIKYKQM